MNQQSTRKKFRLSFVTIGISVAALIITFVFVTVLAAREREQTPRLAVDGLVKALRIYHKQAGRFPADFRELEARVWKRKKAADFGADGRSLSVANYIYLYHQINAGSATISIIQLVRAERKARRTFSCSGQPACAGGKAFHSPSIRSRAFRRSLSTVRWLSLG